VQDELGCRNTMASGFLRDGMLGGGGGGKVGWKCACLMAGARGP
jgi:hypothetical protein